MSQVKYILAIDLGTTRTKGMILDDEANIVVTASLAHSNITSFPGWHELNAEITWWGEFVAVVSRLLSEGEALASDIECICITAAFPCFCPTDEQGVPLHNALLYDDNRSLNFARLLRDPQCPPLEGNELLAQLMWFRDAFPELQSQFRKVFSPHNFVVHRLTGRYCLDSHTAYLFGSVFDPVEFSWRKSELSRAQVEETLLLPEVLPPQTIAGYVTFASARETGLSSGTPVLVGTGDTFASLLSSGAYRRGDLMTYYGSCGLLIQLTQDAKYLLGAQSYLGNDDGIRWHVVLPRSGKQLEQFGSLFQGSEPRSNSFDTLQNLEAYINASEPPSGETLFLHDTGQAKEFITVSVPMATFLMIPVNADVTQLFRAMLEGFGYRIRHGAESAGVINAQARWFAGGGGIRSSVWCQIVTDILDHEQIVSPDSDSALGTALIGGHATSLFDLQTVIEQRIERARVYSPQERLRRFYDERYKKYVHATHLLQSYREEESYRI
jgi:xylulokinase